MKPPIRTCGYAVAGRPGGTCGTPLSGRGRHKWCPTHQAVIREQQRKQKNKVHQRNWRERHRSLYMDRRAIYRAVKKTERWLLERYPRARRKWLHLALVSGYTQAFSRDSWRRNQHFWAIAGMPWLWEACMLMDHDISFKPKFDQPWEIHFGRKLRYSGRFADKGSPYCIVRSDNREEHEYAFNLLLSFVLEAAFNGWDFQSTGILVVMPAVARALSEKRLFVHCRTTNGSSWWAFYRLLDSDRNSTEYSGDQRMNFGRFGK